MARRVEDLPELVTPKEAAEVLNLSRYQLQTLVRERRIGHVPVGSRVMIPRASVREFIANNTVPPCRVETPGPVSASSKSAASIYITWTDRGRSRERSTGTADRLRAEIALADFIRERTRHAGARDPVEVLVTDVLADYASEHAAATASPWRIAYAVEALATFWEGRTVASVSRETCRAYARARERSAPARCGASWACCAPPSTTPTAKAG